jgi:hypothetical protein
MMNSLGTLQSISKYTPTGPPIVANTITSISGTNVAYATNTTAYSTAGFNVYQIKNNVALPTTANVAPTNVTGTFTININNATSTIYYLVIGAGGSSSNSNQGSGGASSGEVKYGSITLSQGTYNCSFQIGGGPSGTDYVASGASYSAHTNGYGCIGGQSALTINGTTYTCKGGNAGGPSYYNNGCTAGSYGAGCGCSYSNSILSGSTAGSKTGGGSPNTSNHPTSAGGGSSAVENGQDGIMNTSSTTGPTPFGGSLGGRPISTTDINLAGFNFTNGIQYFAEGGHGSPGYASSRGIGCAPTTSSYGLSGQSSGIGTSANISATQPVNHTGSGASGAFQNAGGINGTNISPAGSNGVILIAC